MTARADGSVRNRRREDGSNPERYDFGGPPRRPPGPSVKPALIVVGIALGLTVAGAVASGLSGGGSAPGKQAASVPRAKGSPLAPIASGALLRPVYQSGLPPQDVVDALVLPRSAQAVKGSAANQGVGLYDQSLEFRVAASQQSVISFFRAELPAGFWRVVSQGPSQQSGGYQILAQHPGSNGYQWEVGATILPETFQTGSGSANGTTPFVVRLFEVSDAQ